MPIFPINPKCQECGKCSGLGKRMHSVEDLEKIPGICFVEELDLGEDDRREISNPRKEGASIALVDSLIVEDLKTIDTTIASVDATHYMANQNPWLLRTTELYRLSNGRDPNPIEFEDAYSLNFQRYKLCYALLYPELIEVRRPARTYSWDKLCNFLSKADEICRVNIEKHGIVGACDLFRVQMIEAKFKGKKYEPSYTDAIIGFDTDPKTPRLIKVE